MDMYNATVEVATKQLHVDQAMQALAPFHGTVFESERGWAGATISLPAESLGQAALIAGSVVAGALGAEAIACEVMTEAERDARLGWAPVPDLVSVSEAGELLGVSRQRVLQMIGEKKLPGHKVGREYVIPRAALHA